LLEKKISPIFSSLNKEEAEERKFAILLIAT